VKTKEAKMEVFESEISGYDIRAYRLIIKFEGIIEYFEIQKQEKFSDFALINQKYINRRYLLGFSNVLKD